jgi:branched-chain amino acid transport system permease protein
MPATTKPSGYYDTKYEHTLRIIYTPWQWACWICFLIFLILLPFFAGSHILTITIRIGIAIISVIGLNIVVGNTGLLNVGQTAFMAMGAYCSALLMSKAGLNFFLALLGGGFAGALSGLIFGAPSLRVKGFYVALATLAAYFIIIWALMEWFGGTTGHPAPRPKIFNFAFKSDVSYYYLVAALTLFFGLFARNLFRSKIGRAFITIRDHDIAAMILGVDVYKYKVLSFAVGCFYAGIAGALQGHYWGYTNIEAFPFTDSIWYLGMVIVGGLGSVLGSVFGAVFFVVAEELSVSICPAIAKLAPSMSTGFELASALKYMIFSGAIIVFMILEPRGMAHRWDLIKSSFRVYPFNY